MNKKTQFIRMGIASLLGFAMAGSAVSVLAAGAGLSMGGMTIYFPALIAALLAGICSLSGVAAAISGVLLVTGFAAAIAIEPGGLQGIRAVFASWKGTQSDPALIEQGGRLIAVLSAYGLGALFTGLVSGREFVPLANIIFIGLAVVGYSYTDTVSLAAVLPGLIAAVAAFALSGAVQREGSALRILIPAALSVALAFMLVPGERLTWRPLENAAARVQDVFEQYFNFSSERIAFSINEQGYDHAGMVGDEVVAMLGGPANPDTEPVMTVKASEDILLRGTIRTAYTGYSWIDETVKNRYLYYDVTHSGVRDRIFGKAFGSDRSAFDTAQAEIGMLAEGTSTLFVPARMNDFSMDLSTAVYYNSAGEMFMARPVQAGDEYSLTALNPVHGPALADTVLAASEARDDRYTEILAAHTALPAGIDSRVYTLAVELTQGYINPYDKAEAILNYLASNYHYTLEADYPPEGRDFVSWFLLESKEGYCSYFASAMAVMSRIAGLPARYVEGYLARPDASGTAVLTGEDAHAWVEIYFKGLGWISFDASSGQRSGEDGESSDDHTDDGSEMDVPEDELLTTPTPSPTPALHPEDEQNQGLDNFESDDPEPTPTLPPTDEEEDPFDDPFSDPFENPDDGEREDDPWAEKDRDPGWLWIVLGILLALILIALAALIVRARLKNADPIYLSGRTRDGREAAMILYRSILTLLAHMGQSPVSGESPEAFAARLDGQLASEDFVMFVKGVSMNAYAGRPVDRETVLAGRRAYAAFMAAMRPMEKMRFTMTRIFRGLGNFESIP